MLTADCRFFSLAKSCDFSENLVDMTAILPQYLGLARLMPLSVGSSSSLEPQGQHYNQPRKGKSLTEDLMATKKKAKKKKH
jgi:hypothetical protein